MHDPLRTDAVHPPEAQARGERDAKIESLLLTGLDHYFAGEYEQAVTVWMRVLFLDRGHTRARAYIERARSALAEQQRECEELLHNGVAAFQRGETETARRLLNSAVDRGGAQDVALAVLARLNRLEAAATADAGIVSGARQPAVRSRLAPRRRGGGLLLALVLVAASAGALYVFAPWERVASLVSLPQAPAAEVAAPRVPVEPLIIPRSAETALARARALFASGRLYDALRAVNLIRPADPLRPDADRLKADIQGELLAHPLVDVGPAPDPAPPVPR